MLQVYNYNANNGTKAMHELLDNAVKYNLIYKKGATV